MAAFASDIVDWLLAADLRPLRAALAWLVVVPVLAWTGVRQLELERGYPMVPLVAFSQYVVVAALLAVVLALVLRRLAAALLAAVAAATLLADVLPRAIGGEESRAGASLTVMTLNLRVGAAVPSAVLGLADREHVDVLALQELTPEARDALDRSGAARRFPRRSLRPLYGSRGSGVLATKRVVLRSRAEQAGQTFRTAVADIALCGTPSVEIRSFHASSPQDARSTARWARDLQILPAASRSRHPRLIAGDFNATLDHRLMRRLLDEGYRDAAEVVGVGLLPTRERSGRVPLPATIDHVLVDRRVAIRDVSVHEVAGTDHRAVIADVTLPRVRRAPAAGTPGTRC